MVKTRNEDITKTVEGKGSEDREQRARKINASTDYETCSEQLCTFGGLLGLIKFFNLVHLKEIFEHSYIKPRHELKLGNYRMVIGIQPVYG